MITHPEGNAGAAGSRHPPRTAQQDVLNELFSWRRTPFTIELKDDAELVSEIQICVSSV